MSTELDTRDDTVTGLSTIEGIDLDAEVMCGHSMHTTHHADEPAKYLVQVHPHHCAGARSGRYPVCESGWHRMAPGVRCSTCDAARPRALALTIVEHLR